jgi:hypothetical protein
MQSFWTKFAVPMRRVAELVPVNVGDGSTGDPSNFGCGDNPVGPDTENCNAVQNERIFSQPFIPSAPCPGCAL